MRNGKNKPFLFSYRARAPDLIGCETRRKPSGQLPDGRLISRKCRRRCAIALPDPANQCAIAAQNGLRQKTHFASRLKWITPVQPCREKYFAFGFSEIGVS
jgi:hypothetical protein